MNMEYENYYENGGVQEKKPRRPGKILLIIFLTLIVLSVIGGLIYGVIWSMSHMGMPKWQDILPDMPDGARDPFPGMTAPTPAPQPTPLPTERPMAALDGIAPEILDIANPIPDIADSVGESVVGVSNYIEGLGGEYIEVGGGSGFIISTEGYVLTNSHVVEDAKRLTVTLLGGEEIEAELMGTDKHMDIAVLKINMSGLKALHLGNSDKVRVGEFVVAVGTPLSRELEGSITMGIISARSRDMNIDGKKNTYIQTDAAINLGNSGGPLLNMKGEVVGINTAKAVIAGYDEYGQSVNAEGLGFALPINEVMTVVPALITKGYVQRPGIGVTIRTLTKQEAEENGLEDGVLVYSTVRGGPAEQAGLLPGDIITACDGQSITDQNALTKLVSKGKVGGTLRFEVLRDEETLEIVVTIGDSNNMDFDDTNAIE